MSSHVKTKTKTKASGRKRVFLAGGTLLGIGALITAAAFTDFANLNLGGDGTIGSESPFDIAVVQKDNTVVQADTDAGVDWAIADSDSFVPGKTLETTIPVFNNSKTISGDLEVAVQTIGDGSVGASPNIVEFLRFSAKDLSTGHTLFGDPDDPTNGGVELAFAVASISDVAARGSDSLAEGDAYVAGDQGAEHKIVLYVHYVDIPETSAYNGGQTALRMHIDATTN
jgi:hypothetical protein